MLAPVVGPEGMEHDRRLERAGRADRIRPQPAPAARAVVGLADVERADVRSDGDGPWYPCVVRHATQAPELARVALELQHRSMGQGRKELRPRGSNLAVGIAEPDRASRVDRQV